MLAYACGPSGGCWATDGGDGTEEFLQRLAAAYSVDKEIVNRVGVIANEDMTKEFRLGIMLEKYVICNCKTSFTV